MVMGGAALDAHLGYARDVAFAPDGTWYISTGRGFFFSPNDYNRVRRVSQEGIITTLAGTGPPGFSGDGGPAIDAQLREPTGIDLGSDGSLYIADRFNQRIRRIDPEGIITTVAGSGACAWDGCSGGFAGDGGPATEAQLDEPSDVVISSDGTLFIADSANHRIRRIDSDSNISTVAGNGVPGFSGDRGPATEAQLFYPAGLALGPDGSLYIADVRNDRIRCISPSGIITTVAGTGEEGFSGDGGPATAARLDSPWDVDIGSDGSLYIADEFNARIRRVDPQGMISTVAGTGETGPIAETEGALALNSYFWPNFVTLDPAGDLYSGSDPVWKISSVFPAFTPGEFLAVSSDGRNAFKFSGGRHVQTLDTLTGSLLYEFSYGSAGLLASITDGDENVTTIERDSSGNPLAIVSPYGQRTTFTLDPNGYLAGITNPAGETRQFGYSDDGLLTSQTDSRGNVFTYSYEDSGLLIRAEDPLSGFQQLARTELENGFEVTRTTAMGKETRYEVETPADGGQRRLKTLPSGHQTEQTFGADGSRSVSYPDGTSFQFSLGPDSRFGMEGPLAKSGSIALPGGLTANREMNESSTLADSSDPFSLQSRTEEKTLNGRTYTTTYSADTAQITHTTPESRSFVETLDSQGRVVERQLSNLEPTRLVHDSRGRTKEFGVGDRMSQFEYDSSGFLASFTDALGRTTSFVRDPAGRILQKTGPAGNTTAFTYDAEGRVISVTPPGRPSHDFAYDERGFFIQYTPPDLGLGGLPLSHTYNLDRQLIEVTMPDGRSIERGYDAAGRLSSVTIPRGTITRTYDPASGKLASVVTPEGEGISYTYEGNLLQERSWTGEVAGSVSHTFDNNLNVASQSVNGAHESSMSYNQDGLCVQTGDLAIERHTGHGRITGTSIGNVVTQRTFNEYGELTSLTAQYDGTTIYEAHYTHDLSRRLTHLQESINGITTEYDFSYDLANRLVEVKKDSAVTSNYSYDQNGNRLSNNALQGAYDAQDRLLIYGNLTYEYGLNGDLQRRAPESGPGRNYTYDLLGNLTSVELADGREIVYVVDGANRRVGKKVDGVLVQGFLYKSRLHPIAELNGSGDVVSRFVYGTRENVPDYMVRGGRTYRIVSDHLASPRLVIDVESGAIAQRLDYDEFGQVVLDSNPGFQPFGFAGGLYDPDTTLYRFGLRDYDPEIGRWTNKDPALFRGGLENLYVYAENNPVSYVDHNGSSAQPYGQKDLENSKKRPEDLSDEVPRGYFESWEDEDGRIHTVGRNPDGTFTDTVYDPKEGDIT